MKVRENPVDLSEVVPPPAYFLSLVVENFRCFSSPQKLDLSDKNGRPAQWTVLLGENGVGKTTLLQCLAFLQPSWLSLPGGDFDGYLPYSWNFQGKLNGDSFRSINLSDAEISKGHSSLDAEIIRGYRLQKINSDMSKSDLFRLNVIDVLGTCNAEILQDDITGLVSYGYGASRRMSRSAITERRGLNDACDTLFVDNIDLINAEEWLAQSDYAAKISAGNGKEDIAQRRLTLVKNLLIEILPDVTEFRFVTSNDKRMTPRVEAKTPYGWVRVAELSLGYKTSLTWMVDFASRLFDRYPDSPNPLAEPAICLVDEIDLHLHPRWQRELVQKLTETFPNTQFIVTAHSPLIVQAAPNANLALLRREGDHVVIDNDVDEIRNWRVDQILTSDLFGLETARPPQLAPALEERRRILSQPDLTDADKARVAKLDAEINEKTSVGENPLEMRALDALRRAAALLERDEAAQKTAR